MVTPEVTALIHAGKLDEAAAKLQEAIRRSPGDIDSRLLLACLCEKAGKAMAAFLLYRQILDMDPAHQAAATGLLENSYHVNATLDILDRVRAIPGAREKVAELERPVDLSASDLRLNLGCGRAPRPGYVNIDLFIDHPLVTRMDVGKLDLPDGCAREILSVHVLEHFGKNEVPGILSRWIRLLAPGGKLDLEVPDLEWCLTNWLQSPEAERWGGNLDLIFGQQDHGGELHKTGFTAARLAALLANEKLDAIEISRVYSHGQISLSARAVKRG